MNPEEYPKLRAIEERHWFYRGKRRIVSCWMDRYIDLKPEDLLIDAGMGTGAWTLEMTRRCRVLGLDDHDESLALAGPLLERAGGSVLKSPINSVPLPSGVAAVVTLLDVLEHVEDDQGALREMIRLTRAGGLILLTVPALPWLWSDWDEALHHRRRYTRRQLLRLTNQPGVRLLRCAYFNTAMLLPIAAVRWGRRLLSRRQVLMRLEDRLPPRVINEALYQILVCPSCWPFMPQRVIGVSLLAVLRRE